MNTTTYNFVIYNEMDIITLIEDGFAKSPGKSISQYKYAYILHDMDINEETGELKKPHWHLWVQFPAPVKSRDIENIMSRVGLDTSALSHTRTDNTFLAYLTHDTKRSKEKAIYDQNNIVTNIDPEMFATMRQEALEKACKPSRQEKKVQESAQYTRMVLDLVDENESIDSFETLVRFVSALGDDGLLSWIIARAYLCRSMCEETWKRRKWKPKALKPARDFVQEMSREELLEAYNSTRLKDDFDPYKQQIEKECIRRGFILCAGLRKEEE